MGEYSTARVGRIPDTGFSRGLAYARLAVTLLVKLLLVALAFTLLAAFTPDANAANAPSQTKSLKAAPIVKPGAFRLPAGVAGSTRAVAQAKLQPTFDAAVRKIPALREDTVRARWRQPWEELRDTFLSVYQARADGPLAPRALMKAAECQYSLAEASRKPEEFRLAITMYEAVANEYPKSDQAAPSLHAALSIAQERGRGEQAATYARRLQKGYPKSLEARNAAKLLTGTKAPAKVPAKKADPVELENLRWDTISKDKVEIVLEFSGPANVEARLLRPDGRLPRVDLNIHDASVVSEIRRGISIKGSLLRKVSVRHAAKDGTHVYFDFSNVTHFSTARERNATRVVLKVDTLKDAAPARSPATAAKDTLKARPAAAAVPAKPRCVRTVTIDAGHGGKDPGTFHNNIVERTVTLDVATRLGRILQDHGLRVVYTRKKNVTVSLADRTALANSSGSDLFVSIHVNANAKPGIRGFETYFLNAESRDRLLHVAARENGGARAPKEKTPIARKASCTGQLLESQRLAYDIQRGATRRVRGRGMPIVDNGVKSAPFFVLGTARMPAVLAEIGYCTNERDAQMLAKASYRQAIAEGIAEGILAYRARGIARMTADGSPRARTKAR